MACCLRCTVFWAQSQMPGWSHADQFYLWYRQIRCGTHHRVPHHAAHHRVTWLPYLSAKRDGPSPGRSPRDPSPGHVTTAFVYTNSIDQRWPPSSSTTGITQISTVQCSGSSEHWWYFKFLGQIFIFHCQMRGQLKCAGNKQQFSFYIVNTQQLISVASTLQ